MRRSDSGVQEGEGVEVAKSEGQKIILGSTGEGPILWGGGWYLRLPNLKSATNF